MGGQITGDESAWSYWNCRVTATLVVTVSN
jgi:hypothetical protein